MLNISGNAYSCIYKHRKNENVKKLYSECPFIWPKNPTAGFFETKTNIFLCIFFVVSMLNSWHLWAFKRNGWCARYLGECRPATPFFCVPKATIHLLSVVFSYYWFHIPVNLFCSLVMIRKANWINCRFGKKLTLDRKLDWSAVVKVKIVLQIVFCFFHPLPDHFSRPPLCTWPVTLQQVALSICFHFINLSKLHISANTTPSQLHTGRQSPIQLTKQHLISSWACWNWPACPLSLLRTSKVHKFCRSQPSLTCKVRVCACLQRKHEFLKHRSWHLKHLCNFSPTLQCCLWVLKFKRTELCSRPTLTWLTITRSLFLAKFTSVARIPLPPPTVNPCISHGQSTVKKTSLGVLKVQV